MVVKWKILRPLFPLFFLDGEAGDGAAPPAPDREDRIAAATALWKEGDTPDPGAGGDPDQAAADKAAAEAANASQRKEPDGKEPDAAKAAEAKEKAAAAAGDDSKLPYFNDARFQEIYKERNEQKTTIDAFQEIFSDKEGKLGYTIDSTETLKGVLADAYSLYNIANGKDHPGTLLDVMKGNWTPEQFKGVLQGLADYCSKNGVKPDEKSGAAEPWRKEVDDVKAQLSAREKSDKEAVEVKDRMDNVVNPLLKKVEELAAKAGFDPKNADDAKEIEDYILAISAAARSDKNFAKIEAQIRKGQFGEVERLFTEYHNKLVARAKRYGDLTLKQKQDKDKAIPKTPAGGAAPGAAGAKAGAKRDLKTSEGRVAAAREEWAKSKSA